MSYDYRSRVVYVEHLAVDRHPSRYDLCVGHATALVVPRGWTCQSELGNVTSLRSRAG